MSERDENNVTSCRCENSDFEGLVTGSDNAPTASVLVVGMPPDSAGVVSYYRDGVTKVCSRAFDGGSVCKCFIPQWCMRTLTLRPHGFKGSPVTFRYAYAGDLGRQLHAYRPADGYHIDAVRKTEIGGKTAIEFVFINPHAACAFYTMIADNPDEVHEVVEEATPHTVPGICEYPYCGEVSIG